MTDPQPGPNTDIVRALLTEHLRRLWPIPDWVNELFDTDQWKNITIQLPRQHGRRYLEQTINNTNPYLVTAEHTTGHTWTGRIRAAEPETPLQRATNHRQRNVDARQKGLPHRHTPRRQH